LSSKRYFQRWLLFLSVPKKNQRYDDLYFTPSKDKKQTKRKANRILILIVDTLLQQNPNIIVNNYYNDDPFYYSNMIGRFYHGGFNYWYYKQFLLL